jgi:hypothetical protein
MTTRASLATVKGAVFRYNEADQEEVDDVEDTDTPNDLSRGSGDFSLRVCGLGSGQTSKFSSSEGE